MVRTIFFIQEEMVFLKLKIFGFLTRWGEIVFEKSNFNANDASSGWDGTYKGRKTFCRCFCLYP